MFIICLRRGVQFTCQFVQTLFGFDSFPPHGENDPKHCPPNRSKALKKVAQMFFRFAREGVAFRFEFRYFNPNNLYL
jgi:hypothetical protein